MAFLQCTDVSLAFGERDILKNCALFLKDGSRAALCGANGSGKTTLLSLLAGKIQAESGAVTVEKNARVSYLPQQAAVDREKSLYDEAETAFDRLKAYRNEAALIEDELSRITQDGTRAARLLESLQRLNALIEDGGYDLREKTIAGTLRGLGFCEQEFDKKCGAFSGGWQMRIALAKVLLEAPDILLLDEPTNYLDLEARAWLGQYLLSFKGAYVLVSHDRYFLDQSVTEVYELFQGRLTRYAGNYTAYLKIRETQLRTLEERYKEQQEYVKKTEALIEKFRYKASKAAFAQELVKKLERLEPIELPAGAKKLSLSFPPPPHCGKTALTLTGITKRYGDTVVLNELNLTVDRGERLAVAGKNGAGKTTLLRIIAGADGGFEGSVRRGAGTACGYFDQDTAAAIRGGKTVLQFACENAGTQGENDVRAALGAFLFHGDDVYKTLDVLSGGEKSRLALLALILRPLNLLVLDEPTNHLDLDAKDILRDALKNWGGTAVFVSHDRAFLEELSTKTLELRSGGQARLFYGNYAYYREKTASEPRDATPPSGARGAGAAQERGHARQERARARAKGTAADGLTDGARERAARKEAEARARRHEREERALIERIETLEAERDAILARLCLPEVYSSGEKTKAENEKLALTNRRIDEAAAYWESLDSGAEHT
jgi:ATP-binding cassette subfamily F protein 3